MHMYRTSGIIKTLIAIILILLPGLAIWFFFSKDWTRDPVLSYPYTWIIAGAFIIVTFVITFIFIKMKWAWYDLLNFTFPITVLMMVILITYPLPSWTRALIIIPGIIAVTLPTNIIVGRITDEAKRQEERKNDDIY